MDMDESRVSSNASGICHHLSQATAYNSCAARVEAVKLRVAVSLIKSPIVSEVRGFGNSAARR
jgi:hypothetical protein